MYIHQFDTDSKYGFVAESEAGEYDDLQSNYTGYKGFGPR